MKIYTIIGESVLFKATGFRCYFSYQNITPEIKKEIINYVIESKYTVTVSSLEGSYDLLFFIIAKTVSEAYLFWEKLLDKYRDYFSKKEFHVFNYQYDYDYLFLLDEMEYKKENRKPINKIYYNAKKQKVNNFDNQILKLISQNPRIPAIEITNKLNSTAATIRNRIKKLKESDIIKGFTVNIDWTKIGYYIYKVDIELRQSKNYKKIIKYIELNPNLVFLFKSIGYFDLEFVFILNNAHQLHQIMEDLSKKFPDSIKNYTYFCVVETHKLFKY